MNNQIFNIISIIAVICIFVTLISIIYVFFRLITYFIRKSPFPRIGLIAFLLSASLVMVYAYNFYNNLDFLPKGILNQSISSPNGQYEIRTYHYTNIFSRAARAELYEKESKRTRTIYFNDYDYSPYVEWLGNNRVRIGRETLDITKNERYDYRKEQLRHTELPPQG